MHVAIIGLGPTADEFLDTIKRLGGRRAYCDEVWGINCLGDVFACDRVFHMDDVRIQEARAAAKPPGNIAAMLRWMRTCPGPIYTSRLHPDYPGLMEFPLEEVINHLGYGYFNSTAAYAVAYAVHIAATKISLFGMDFTYPNRHDAEKGRACVEFWLGQAAARGIKIAMPRTTSLMDALVPEDRKLYGYDTLNVNITPTADRVLVKMTPRAVIASAEEMEARYDHSKHPNELMNAEQGENGTDTPTTRAHLAFSACLQLPGVEYVLDIGSGDGDHAAGFAANSKKVTTISMREPANIVGDYCEHEFDHAFDLIWASHVLEHQRNPGEFLEKCRRDLKPGGWLAVTVPPMKQEVVGGHVAMFNAGILLYHLVLAGFDCSGAAVRAYGYNVSVIVRNQPATLPVIERDCGDIERLAHLFPMPVKQGFDGNIERLNWHWGN